MITTSHSFYIAVSGLIFALAGVLHGLRAFYGWEMLINDWMVPIWVSWLVVLVMLIMTLTAIKNLK